MAFVIAFFIGLAAYAVGGPAALVIVPCAVLLVAVLGLRLAGR